MKIKYGECHCGCGGKTNISKRNQRGHKKGQPVKFINGHHLSKTLVAYVIDKKTGCWNWQLCKTPKGYGSVWDRKAKKLRRAHRYYYEKYKGKVPQWLELDHLCRNRACVNPDHLEVVTGKENVRRGSVVKLNIEKANEIRKLVLHGIAKEEIAKKYKITKENIRPIIMNKTWI